MTDTVVKDVLDRIHAVHEEIKTVNANLTLKPQRYFTGYKGIAALPQITPFIPSGVHDNTSYGSDVRHSVWSIPIVLLVDDLEAGSGGKDAQKNTEACIDHLVEAYWNRPRLETVALGALEWVLTDARLTQNTELQTVPETTIATVRFTLVVETTTDMERI
jgi:hypothetical protein